jgi:hypothetical protein
MSKKEVIKVLPKAHCIQRDNGRYYIFDDDKEDVPSVFPHGHKSPAKAWSDLKKYIGEQKLA